MILVLLPQKQNAMRNRPPTISFIFLLNRNVRFSIKPIHRKQPLPAHPLPALLMVIRGMPRFRWWKKICLLSLNSFFVLVKEESPYFFHEHLALPVGLPRPFPLSPRQPTARRRMMSGF